MTPTNLQALSHYLEHWQALYIISINLALIGIAGIILFNFLTKGKLQGLRWSTYVYIAASAIALVSTIVIITKTRSLDAEKDRQLKLFETQANVQIQQLKTIEAQANEKAQDAELKSETASLQVEETSKENSLLRIDVAKEEAVAKKMIAELAAQTEQFGQGLPQQRQSKAQPIQAAPSLENSQINAIAESLKPFAGQTIAIHMMMDIRCQSLGAEFRKAFDIAGIKISNYITTLGGPKYRGVLVVVKNPSPSAHPVLADALFKAVVSVGLQPHRASDPALPEEGVGVYIAPE